MKLFGIENEPTRALQDLENSGASSSWRASTATRSAGTSAATVWRRCVTGSTDRAGALDLERDLPTTTREDVEALRRLAHLPMATDPVDGNLLRGPFWTMEKALAARFFRDSDEPFEL
jgi:hypothetical protein